MSCVGGFNFFDLILLYFLNALYLIWVLEFFRFVGGRGGEENSLAVNLCVLWEDSWILFSTGTKLGKL